MVIVDWMLDWWLRAQEVRVDLRTFVDDWGVLFREASAFERVWTALEQFTNQLDLAIDMAKTRLCEAGVPSGPPGCHLGCKKLGSSPEFQPALPQCGVAETPGSHATCLGKAEGQSGHLPTETGSHPHDGLAPGSSWDLRCPFGGVSLEGP